MGPTAGLNVLVRRKILFCREQNPGRPARHLVITMTELPGSPLSGEYFKARRFGKWLNFRLRETGCHYTNGGVIHFISDISGRRIEPRTFSQAAGTRRHSLYASVRR